VSEPTTDVTPIDMINLLQIAARYTPLTFGDDDVEAWMVVAALDAWPLAAARAAVIQHCQRIPSDAPWIKPGDVSKRIREIERLAMVSFEDPVMPKELPDGMTWPEYLRAKQREHKRRHLDEWARTGIEPKPVPPPPLGSGDGPALAGVPDEIRPAIEAGLRRMGGRRL
jgi:hypothetical protein